MLGTACSIRREALDRTGSAFFNGSFMQTCRVQYAVAGGGESAVTLAAVLTRPEYLEFPPLCNNNIASSPWRQGSGYHLPKIHKKCTIYISRMLWRTRRHLKRCVKLRILLCRGSSL